MQTGTHKPYRKENDNPVYVNIESNHPPSIKRQLPNMIAKRLTGLSSTSEDFEEAKPIYEKALNEAGYKDKLKFNDNENETEQSKNKKRKRTRNITWYTPPYNQNVKTNLTKEFLKILDTSFPADNPLRKIFNKNTVKISYSTTKNISRIIAAHNRKLINPKTNDIKGCNCRGGIENCPAQGKCQESGILYQADVTAENEDIKTYIGATATTFKLRHANHKKSFNHRKYEFDTEISKYIWELKDKDKVFTIKWKILRSAYPYNPASEKCDLCLTEKTMIANYINKNQLLNTRNELMAKCRHREKWLLCNWKNGTATKVQGRKKNAQKHQNKAQTAANNSQAARKIKPRGKKDKNPPNDTDNKKLPKRIRKSTKRDDHIY